MDIYINEVNFEKKEILIYRGGILCIGGSSPSQSTLLRPPKFFY